MYWIGFLLTWLLYMFVGRILLKKNRFFGEDVLAMSACITMASGIWFITLPLSIMVGLTYFLLKYTKEKTNDD